MPIELITLATFLTVTAVTITLGDALRGESVVSRRVQQLSGVQAGPARPLERRSGLLSRVLTTVGNGLGGDHSLTRRLSAAGLRGANAPAVFPGAAALL